MARKGVARQGSSGSDSSDNARGSAKRRALTSSKPPVDDGRKGDGGHQEVSSAIAAGRNAAPGLELSEPAYDRDQSAGRKETALDDVRRRRKSHLDEAPGFQQCHRWKDPET